MEHLLTPSGPEDGNSPWSRTGSNGVLTGCFAPDLGGDLGVRSGESDPRRMLAAVLLLVAAVVLVAMGLAWWLV